MDLRLHDKVELKKGPSLREHPVGVLRVGMDIKLQLPGVWP